VQCSAPRLVLWSISNPNCRVQRNGGYDCGVSDRQIDEAIGGGSQSSKTNN